MDILDSGTVTSVISTNNASVSRSDSKTSTTSTATVDQKYYQYYVGDDAARTPKRTSKRKRHEVDGDGAGISPPVHTLSPFIFQQKTRKPIATRRYGSPLSPIDTSTSQLTYCEMLEVARNTPITPMSPWSRQDMAYSPTESPSTVIYPVSESRERSPSHYTHYSHQTHRVAPNQSFRAHSPTGHDPQGHAHGHVHLQGGRPVLRTAHLNLTRHHKREHKLTRIEHLQNASMNTLLKQNMSVSDLIEMDLVSKFIADQSGSRYLQRLMSVNRDSKSQKRKMEEQAVRDNVSALIKYCVDNHGEENSFDLTAISEHVYGNYIVQILFVEGSEREQGLFLDTFISANIVRLSKSTYGCRVIQKCLVTAKRHAFLCQMVRSFDDQTKGEQQVHDALLGPYTNHVVQAMLDLKLDCDSFMLFIKDTLESNMALYGEHVFGCRIIQCFIKNYGDKLDVLKLINTRQDHLYLCKTKYGNYVIQCIIQKGQWHSAFPRMVRFRNKLIEDVSRLQQILLLSKNKFGSNVMETCLKVANRRQKNAMLWVMVNNPQCIPLLIRNCFGNYVVKALLVESNPKNQAIFRKAILKSCPSLRTSDQWKFAKDIVKEINRIEAEGK